MRASKREGKWKCFKKAGRGCLRTTGFKHIGRFSESRGIFDSLDSSRTERWTAENKGALHPRRPGSSHQFTNDRHGLGFFNLKKKCKAQHHQHSFIIFFYCNNSQKHTQQTHCRLQVNSVITSLTWIIQNKVLLVFTLNEGNARSFLTGSGYKYIHTELTKVQNFSVKRCQGSQ